MQKGTESMIMEARKNIASTINGELKRGIPFSVVSLIIESSLLEIQQALRDILNKEEEDYNKKLQAENNQVKYEEPEKVNAELV